MELLNKLLKEENGAAIVEYSMALGLIALVSFTILVWLGWRVRFLIFRFLWTYVWW